MKMFNYSCECDMYTSQRDGTKARGLFQLLTGRVEEIRNNMNPGENSKRKKKDPKSSQSQSVVKTYPSQDVQGYTGDKDIDTLMTEQFPEELESNHKNREHGKGKGHTPYVTRRTNAKSFFGFCSYGCGF